MDIYTINDYINDATNTINHYKTIIKAIENIEIVTKKDGTPFKVFSKNFKNCEIVGGTWYSDTKIRIYYKFGGYQYTDIDIKPVVEYYTRPFKVDGAIIKQQYLMDVYDLTINDIKNELQYQIELYKYWIEQKQQQLEYFKKHLKTINNYINKLNAIVDGANIKNKYNGINDVDYNIRGYISNNIDCRYPYDHITLVKDF